MVLHAPPPASPVAQSAGPEHPQLPPPVTARQAFPRLSVEQSRHAAPDAPQAAAAVPTTHVPDEPQHPSLQSWLVEHWFVHWWVVVSHAWPVGQSVGPSHPH